MASSARVCPWQSLLGKFCGDPGTDKEFQPEISEYLKGDQFGNYAYVTDNFDNAIDFNEKLLCDFIDYRRRLQAVPPNTIESIMLRDFYLHRLKAMHKRFKDADARRMASPQAFPNAVSFSERSSMRYIPSLPEQV